MLTAKVWIVVISQGWMKMRSGKSIMRGRVGLVMSYFLITEAMT